MYDINLITTVIGFGMSSVFIVFICARLICRRMQLTESRRSVDHEPEINTEQPVQRAHGLEPLMVAAIPTMKFHRDAFSSSEDLQCSICLGDYQEKEVLRIMPKCGHSFHLSCIDPWLMKQSTCPVCRLPLKHSCDPKLVGSDDDIEPSRENSNQLPQPGLTHTGYVSSQQHHQSTSSNDEFNLRGDF